MIEEIFIFIAALFLVIKGATMATTHSAKLAEGYRLSKYLVGFIIVSIISILPETFIAVNSAVRGVPSFGLGTLLGSNVADLTLIFGLIILLVRKRIKVESKVLKERMVYPFLLLLPLLLGFDGSFSRMEGIALIIAGVAFYYIAIRDGIRDSNHAVDKRGRYKSLAMLIFSMAVLLLGSHFVVTSASSLAGMIGVSPILIGMLVVGIGTTIPELFFAVKSHRKDEDSLAVGDILGTVLANATIVVGIMAVVIPFSFPVKLIYVTGLFMFLGSLLLFHFMRTGRNLSKKEAWSLILFWVVFVLIEIIVQ